MGSCEFGFIAEYVSNIQEEWSCLFVEAIMIMMMRVCWSGGVTNDPRALLIDLVQKLG